MIQEIQPGGFFNDLHPPPTDDIALARLRELEEAIRSIQSQFKRRKAKNFSNQLAYSVWKGNATKALSSYQVEMDYLQRYLNALGVSFQKSGDPELQAKKNKRREMARGNREGVERVRKFSNRLAEELRQRYTTVYTEIFPPQDFSEARKRKGELVELLEECKRFLKELRGAAGGNDIGRKKIIPLKKPLLTIHQEIINELGILARYFRQNALQGPQGMSWDLFLLSLLDRAFASGFKITDEERETVEAIRAAKQQWTK